MDIQKNQQIIRITRITAEAAIARNILEAAAKSNLHGVDMPKQLDFNSIVSSLRTTTFRAKNIGIAISHKMWHMLILTKQMLGSSKHSKQVWPFVCLAFMIDKKTSGSLFLMTFLY